MPERLSSLHDASTGFRKLFTQNFLFRLCFGMPKDPLPCRPDNGRRAKTQKRKKFYFDRQRNVRNFALFDIAFSDQTDAALISVITPLLLKLMFSS